MPLTQGSSFGPYRILEPLGRGGMATVFKAYEAALDRYIALKVLPADFLHDPTFAERFRREAKSTARLEHPNIIPMYASGIEEGVPWMAMRLIPGGTLSSALKAGGLDARRSIAILGGVAGALDYAHRNGVVHRDVKPQNVLLDDAGHVYLADFGIARMVEGPEGLTKTGIVTGTPQYMAPEQARGESIDHRVDIYALGIMAYELLSGHVPFTADTPVAVLMKHILDPIPIPQPERVPESLLRPLLKCLDKDPKARWPTATAFVKALEQVLITETAPTQSLDAPAPRATQTQGAPSVPTARLPPTAAAGKPPAGGPPTRPQPAPPRPAATPAPQTTSRRGPSKLAWLFVAGALASLSLLVGLSWFAYQQLVAQRPAPASAAPDSVPTPETAPALAVAPAASPPPAESPASAEPPMPSAQAARPPVAERSPAAPTAPSRPVVAPTPTEAPAVAAPNEAKPPAVEPAAAAPKAGELRRHSQEEADYAWIPAGSFEMGCVPGDADCDANEKPRHPVALGSGFWMARGEVTAGGFARFARQTQRPMPPAPLFNLNWALQNHPIVNVSWELAKAYCEWAGGRLPSEAEWEYAARGGREGLLRVWGPEEQPQRAGKRLANVADLNVRRKNPTWPIFDGYDDGYPETSPVGSFPPNGFSLVDMAGNASEWVADWYDSGAYAKSPPQDPTGPVSGSGRVLRGGSYLSGPKGERASVRVRLGPRNWLGTSGFRCARDGPP